MDAGEADPLSGGIVALDMGTYTGWAAATLVAIERWPAPLPGLTGPIDGVSYGVQHFNGATSLPVLFDGWLANFMRGYRPHILIVEKPIPDHKGNRAAVLAHAFYGVAEAVAARYQVTMYDEHVGRIKKHFAGTGRAKKEDMIARCHQRGWDPQRHDTADALGLLDLAVWLLHTSKKR